MEITEVLKSLERNTGIFPREAVEAAMEMRGEITPALLQILEDTIERAAAIVAEDEGGSYFAHLYAMYLLAQFREKRAYPLIVRFARLDEALLEVLAGEFITEDLCRVLASVCDGDTGLIEQLIEDESADDYVRSAALRSMLVLVGAGTKSRDEVMAYFKSLFEGKLQRTSSHAWDSLVACACRLHPEEVSADIALAFEEELVAAGYVSPRDVEQALQVDKVAVCENLSGLEGGLIENVAQEMSWWVCFEQPKQPKGPKWPKQPKLLKQPEPPVAYPRPNRPVKVQPNAPCPCGSGKKYKKCCGRLA